MKFLPFAPVWNLHMRLNVQYVHIICTCDIATQNEGVSSFRDLSNKYTLLIQEVLPCRDRISALRHHEHYPTVVAVLEVERCHFWHGSISGQQTLSL